MKLTQTYLYGRVKLLRYDDNRKLTTRKGQLRKFSNIAVIVNIKGLIERESMKKYIGVLFTVMMMCTFSLTAFAQTKEIMIDGESVIIETFGDVELVEPIFIPETRAGVDYFTFNINNSVETDRTSNTHAKWQVQTQACLRDYRNGNTNSDGKYKYTVSVMKGNKALASYEGKTDNILGGLVFSKLPTNANLFIRVKAGTHPAYDFLYGHGETKFLD